MPAKQTTYKLLKPVYNPLSEEGEYKEGTLITYEEAYDFKHQDSGKKKYIRYIYVRGLDGIMYAFSVNRSIKDAFLPFCSGEDRETGIRNFFVIFDDLANPARKCKLACVKSADPQAAGVEKYPSLELSLASEAYDIPNELIDSATTSE